MKTILKTIFLFLLVSLFSCTKPVKENGLTGDYLGQKLPGNNPEIFARGIVSTGMFERDLTISPDGSQIYYSVRYADKFAIVTVKRKNGIWSKPEVAPFSGLYSDIEPYIQPDGKRLYFVSKRPLKADTKNKYDYNMWYCTKDGDKWSNPVPLGEPINGSGSVFYPSVTKSGTIYFTRRSDDGSEYIFRSKLVNGKFAEPEKLPDEVNSTKAQYNTFISPEEDFIIVPTWIKDKSIGASDYFISFRDKNDNWSELINMGKLINTRRDEYTPSLSPDGKYFFFQRSAMENKNDNSPVKYSDIHKLHNQAGNGGSDIYWVSSDFIKKLKPKS